MGGEIAKLPEKWDPLVKAQQQSLNIVKQITDEIVRQGQEIQKLERENLAKQRPYGPASARQLDIADQRSRLQGDQSLAAAYQRQIDAAMAEIRAGTLAGTWAPGVNVIPRAVPPRGRSGYRAGPNEVYLTPRAAQAAQRLLGLQVQLQNVQNDAAIAAESIRGLQLDAANENTVMVNPGYVGPAAMNEYWRERNILNPPTLLRPSERYFSADEAALSAPTSLDTAMARAAEQGMAQFFKTRQDYAEQRKQAQSDALLRAQLEPVQRQLTLLGVNAQLSGMNDVDRINAEYNLKIKIAGLEKDLDKAENERYEAALDREKELLEYTQKTRQEQKDAFEETMTGLISAGIAGHAGSYVRGKLVEAGEQLVAKVILGPLFDKTIGKGPQGVSIPDLVGGALKTATDENTTATQDNTDAIDRLTAAIDQANSRGPSLYGKPGSVPPGWGGTTIGGGGGYGPMVLPGFPTTGGLPGLGPLYGVDPSGAPPMGPPGIGGGGAMSSNVMTDIGTAIALGGAGYGMYEGIHSGGARGGLQAAASAGAALGALGKLIPALSGAGAIGMVAGAVLGIASALMGDPKQERANAIQRTLQTSQFVAPVAINASMSTGGTYADYDRFSGVRTSTLSPYPSVQEGYLQHIGNTNTWMPVPGRTVNQFGNSAAGSSAAHITIQALDSKSIMDRHADIADAVNRSLQVGSSTGLRETLRTM